LVLVAPELSLPVMVKALAAPSLPLITSCWPLVLLAI
jgi:hypothetical protein